MQLLHIIYSIQGSHGHGKSCNLKPSWKVTEKSGIFVFFQEVMENCYFKEKVMGFCRNHQYKAMAVSYMYYSVCVVMIGSVRGCHLYLSKKFKFMVKVYFRLCRSYSWMDPTVVEKVLESLNFVMEKSWNLLLRFAQKPCYIVRSP